MDPDVDPPTSDRAPAGRLAAALRDPQLWVPLIVLAIGILVLLWIA